MVILDPDRQAAAGISVSPALRDSVAGLLSIPASVESPDTARVLAGSIVEGRVERVRVIPGDPVPAGAALVHIHSHELVDAERDLAAAVARLAFAAEAVERAEGLLRAGAISREEFRRREVELLTARAEEVRSREMVDHLHPEDGDVVIRSPRAGTVFRVLVRAGEAVVPGTPLVELGSTGTLWVTGALTEGAAPALAPGTGAQVLFPALPGVSVEGRVVRVGAAVDPGRRSVEVRVQLDRVPEGVRPGSQATLELPTGERRAGIRLPEEALQRIGDRDHLFVQEGPDRFRAVPVDAEALGDGTVLVEGVAEGTPVVVAGGYILRSILEVGEMAEGGE